MHKQGSAKNAEQANSVSRDYADKWCTPRGIEYDPVHFADVTTFVPTFRIRNYGYDGQERVDLSVKRSDAGYRQEPGTGVVIYSPHPDAQKKWEEAGEVWLAEVEGKTLALYELGFPVLGIKGIRGWHVKDSTDLHPVLAKLMTEGKKVNVVLDADWKTNDAVRDGLTGCTEAIRGHGGEPVAIDVPPVDGNKKAGIDDLVGQLKVKNKSEAEIIETIRNLPSVANVRPDSTFVPIDDIRRRPPPDWAIHGLIMTGDATTIVGPTSCGKSFLTMDLLLAMATGRDEWFGCAVRRHGLTVHISLEGQGMPSRANAYCKHYGPDSIPDHFVYERPITLLDDKQTHSLIDQLEV